MEIGQRVKINATVYSGMAQSARDKAMVGREGVITGTEGIFIEVTLDGEKYPDMFEPGEFDNV